jgi:hypothetical protein
MLLRGGLTSLFTGLDKLLQRAHTIPIMFATDKTSGTR